MRTLICGSLAYDTIMVFNGRFKDHILPNQVHILNVAFLVPEMRREFGGCAGNIAYSLRLLGGEPLIMATVGSDGQPYLDRLARLNLPTTHTPMMADAFMAQAFITTDLDDNQITAFHPGAMSQSASLHLSDIKKAADVKLGIIAPDSRDGMIQHAEEMAAAGVSFIFDPGQGLPMFDGADLMHFIELADYVTVNEYEAQLLSEKTGLSFAAIAQSVKALIVTQGGLGSTIHADDQTYSIPSLKPTSIADPTGCGDAYRGGLLYGIANGLDWATTGRLASTMGALKIACRGPQNYEPSRDQIAEVFEKAFAYRPW